MANEGYCNVIKPHDVLARLRRWLALVFVLYSYGCGALAATTLLVVHPEGTNPLSGVIGEVVDGMDVGGIPILRQPVTVNLSLDDLRRVIRDRKVGVVVGLGRLGLEAVEGLRTEIPVVVGAVMLPISVGGSTHKADLNGISLAPDPMLLLGKMRDLTPQVKRVFAVFNPATAQEWLKRARQAAAEHGVVLEAVAANDLREAARAYRDILQKLEHGTEALWLAADATNTEEEVILPAVLHQAWEQRALMFSSNSAHVKRGALFSLVPHHGKMGRALALMAQNLAKSTGESPGVVFLKDVLTSVNIRAAQHLHLDAVVLRRREFDLTYPPS